MDFSFDIIQRKTSFVDLAQRSANPALERPFNPLQLSKQENQMKHLSKAEIAVIKARILRGDLYVDIASDYRINQGRIADLKFGRIHASVAPADLSERKG